MPNLATLAQNHNSFVQAPNLWFRKLFFVQTLFDLTDVCPLLTEQYIQVGLQVQYMLYNFLDGLSPHTWYG
jgi:hypothetical protein